MSNNNAQVFNKGGADPKLIGGGFHNPYTFIPFPEEAPERYEPATLTQEEAEEEIYTGIVKVSLQTKSPLLSLAPGEKDAKNFKALTIGKDVIVPATSIRGVLRTLMGIISGGPLSYVDESLYLCQGRDAKPGNGGELGLVIKAGSKYQDGIVELGETQLVKTELLKILFEKNHWDMERARPTQKADSYYWIDDPCAPSRLLKSPKQPEGCPWLLKLSGRKVGNIENKPRKKNGEPAEEHEGAFKPSGVQMRVKSTLWDAYEGRNRNSSVTKLLNGHLIWLFAKEGVPTIQSDSDIASLQWARWGRLGKRMQDLVPRNLLPNYTQKFGGVDIVGDLWGEIFKVAPEEGKSPMPAFAGRIRPDNLVFKDTASKLLRNVQLSPLSNPHPGCRAFYRRGDADELSPTSPLKGYKVYRTTKERGAQGPWNYAVQPIYNRGKAANFQDSDLCRSVELIPENCKGEFNLAFRSLNRAELALLLLTLSCDLRLGGGKPFGLGHCVVDSVKIILDDRSVLGEYTFSKRAEIPEDFSEDLTDEEQKKYMERAELYCKTQIPVEKLRYPFFVETKNGQTANRGGMYWFTTFATPKKNDQPGVNAIRLEKNAAIEFKNQVMKAQILPEFSPDSPMEDQLYGYGFTVDGRKDSAGAWHFYHIGPGNDRQDKNSSYRSENTSQNRQTRQNEKEKRWK